MRMTHEQLQRRLEILRRKLEQEGLYVSANTVIQAQETIRELTGVDVPPLDMTPTEYAP